MADVMTGVPSIVMGLFIYTIWVLRFGVDGVNGFAGALALGLPDAADRDPLHRGDAAAGARRPARGQLRARRPASARTILTVVLPAALPGIVAASCWPSPAPPARRRRCCSPSARPRTINWNLFNGPNTALSVQIFSNAQQPFAGAQERAWGAALTLIVMVFILLVLSRIVAGALQPA